jgi:hypothetical protein
VSGTICHLCLGPLTLANLTSPITNLAIAQQQAKGIVSAQFNFSPDDLADIDSHGIVTDHSQLMTASAGLSYTWKGTRFSVDLLAGTGTRDHLTSPKHRWRAIAAGSRISGVSWPYYYRPRATLSGFQGYEIPR